MACQQQAWLRGTCRGALASAKTREKHKKREIFRNTCLTLDKEVMKITFTQTHRETGNQRLQEKGQRKCYPIFTFNWSKETDMRTEPSRCSTPL